MGIIKLKKNEGRQEVVESEILEKAKECNLTTKGKAEEVLPSWDDPAILREDNSKANAHTCHYVLNNGTTKSVITAKESNYFDEETQKWKEIDNTFVEKEDEFECVCGDVKKQIAKSNKGKSVSVFTGFKCE